MKPDVPYIPPLSVVDPLAAEKTFDQIWAEIVTQPYKDMLPGQWYWVFKMHQVPPLKFRNGSLLKGKCRYHDSEVWKLLSRLTFKKHPNCQECNRRGSQVVDHVVYTDTGMEHPSQIQALCNGCHYRVSLERGQVE